MRKAQPAHFVSEYNRQVFHHRASDILVDIMFNWQEERAKQLSKFAVATLHASSLLSQQFRLTREQVEDNSESSQ